MKIRQSIRKLVLVVALGLLLVLTAWAPAYAQAQSTRAQNEKIIRYIAVAAIVWFIVSGPPKPKK